MKIVLRVVIVALAIIALPRIIDGISVSGIYYAFLAAIALGLVNLLIKPLIKLITLPINLLTLGFFGLVINGFLLWIVALYIPGLDIASYVAAFLGALVISLVNWIVSKI